jgi:hypothetical protein
MTSQGDPGVTGRGVAFYGSTFSLAEPLGPQHAVGDVQLADVVPSATKECQVLVNVTITQGSAGVSGQTGCEQADPERVPVPLDIVLSERAEDAQEQLGVSADLAAQSLYGALQFDAHDLP